MVDLTTILAEREIRQQLNNYCRSMDRCDTAMGLAVFHPESEVDYGPIFQGSGADFVVSTLAGHQYIATHVHRIMNVSIQVNGDTAGSEGYVDARFRMSHEGSLLELNTCGRFIDEWAKHEGRWVIRRRRYLHTTDSSRAVDAPNFPTGGTRDETDISYEVLAPH